MPWPRDIHTPPFLALAPADPPSGEPALVALVQCGAARDGGGVLRHGGPVQPAEGEAHTGAAAEEARSSSGSSTWQGACERWAADARQGGRWRPGAALRHRGGRRGGPQRHHARHISRGGCCQGKGRATAPCFMRSFFSPLLLPRCLAPERALPVHSLMVFCRFTLPLPVQLLRQVLSASFVSTPPMAYCWMRCAWSWMMT